MPTCSASFFPRTASYGGLKHDVTRNRVLCILLLLFSKHQTKSTYPSTSSMFIRSCPCVVASLSNACIDALRIFVTSFWEIKFLSEFGLHDRIASRHASVLWGDWMRISLGNGFRPRHFCYLLAAINSIEVTVRTFLLDNTVENQLHPIT